MGVIAVIIAGVMSTLAILSLPLAIISFLGVMAIIPAAFSIDLGPTLPLVTTARLLMPVLLGALLLSAVKAGRLYVSIPITLMLAICCGAYFASVALSTQGVGAGLSRAIAFAIEDVGLFILTYHVLDSESRIQFLLRLLTVSLLVVSSLAFLELATRQNPLAEMAPTLRGGLVFDYSMKDRFGLPRLQSVFRNPLDFGVFLQLMVPVALGVGVGRGGRLDSLLGVVAAVCGCICAVLTGSRSVIYTFVITMAAFVVFRRKWLAGAITCAVVFVVAAAAVATTNFPIRDYAIGSVIAPEYYHNEVGGSSLLSLVRVSGEHLRMAAQRPLFGWGVGTLPPNAGGERFDPFFVGLGEQGITYLLVEIGIVGMVGFIGIFVVIWRDISRNQPLSTVPWERSVATSIFCGSIGYLAGMQLEGAWHFDLLLVLFAVALRIGGNRRPGASEPPTAARPRTR